MDLRRVPPSVLVALGLAGCVATVDEEDESTTSTTTSTTVQESCLSAPDTCLSSTGPSETTSPNTTTTTDGTGSTGGTGATGTDGGGTGSTGTDGTGTDGDTDATSTGSALAPDRAEVLERLEGSLPADVVERLRRG